MKEEKAETQKKIEKDQDKNKKVKVNNIFYIVDFYY